MPSSNATSPPSTTRLDSKLRRARVRSALFNKATAPLVIGRFALLERVGAGNMGEVYAAYDEKLDRKVAIKLVRSDFEGSDYANERLLREAKILARLSHPNVVQVYDVGLFEERVFIAMELIRGQTMTQWLKTLPIDEKRTARILDRFIAAGKGLEAGHRAGLTHRDFKPDNILVSHDDRVVVADFGLARLSTLERGAEQATADDERSTPLPESFAEATSRSSGITPRGTALGTPAYMASEVYDGAVADARSDQFSFCVALYEALYGERPFKGASVQELRSAIDTGRVSFPRVESAVPASVRAVLARGLSKDPNDRFADMSKLLYALEDRPARRLIVPLAVVAALLAVVVVSLLREAESSCTGPSAEMTGVDRPERRESIKKAISQVGTPYAQDAWPRVERGLDAYSEAWSATRRDVCLAREQGNPSSRLSEARMACLEHRLAAFDSALSVLSEIESRSLSSAVQVVENLPAVDDCSDPAALGAAVPLPADPEEKRRVSALRKRLIQAQALENSGRYKDALDIATQVASEAGRIENRPLLADALLLEGRTTLTMGAGPASMKPLQRTLEIGIEAGYDELAVESWARLIFASGTTSPAKGQESSDPLEQSFVIEALGRRLPPHSFARALLYNNLGTIYMARQDRERAREYFAQAVEARSRGGDAASRTELIYAAQNLAMVSKEPAVREELMAGGAKELSETLGPSHPQTMRQLVHFASYIRNPKEARETLSPACERYRQSGQPEGMDGLYRCLYLIAFLHAELGDIERAGATLSELAERIPESDRPYSSLRQLARGAASLYRHREREALSALTEARKGLPEAPEQWWINKDIGDAELGSGLALLELAEYDAARAALGRAIGVYEGLVGISYNTEYQHRLAQARTALARALLGNGPVTSEARERARELNALAASWYDASGQAARAAEVRGAASANVALKAPK